MKKYHFLSLFICIVMFGCGKNEPQQESQHITVNHNHLDIMPKMYQVVTVTSNVNWATVVDDGDIADVEKYEKNDDGTETIYIRALKQGRTKIRLSEAKTFNYETVIDVECVSIRGLWREQKAINEELKYSVSVIADPAIQTEIENALYAEARSRYGAEYDFVPWKKVFTMQLLTGESYTGTFEHTNNNLTLNYDGITEKYWIEQGEKNFYLVSDQYEKFQKLYPGYSVVTAKCQRCLSMVVVH